MSYRPYNKITTVAISDTRTNNTGVTMAKGTPARINSNGELDFVDVSLESSSFPVVGLISQDIADGSFGNFLTVGKVTDITTTASFGDVVFVSKTGGLTNIKPTIGVEGFIEGDFVIQVGVVAKNEDNPSLKDLILNVSLVSQL